jgi:hypothetical protein
VLDVKYGIANPRWSRRTIGMRHDMICEWLGLSPGTWPPDHYALLGLERSVMDVERIEEHVHERLMRLRHHQLSHPEEVTEAMNRLARAFSCLTKTEAREAYDRALDHPGEAVATADEGLQAPLDPLAWLFGPWNQLALYSGTARPKEKPPPAHRDWAKEPPPARRRAAAEEKREPATTTLTAGTTAEAAPSATARQGLGTRKGLYRRARATRRLLAAWDRVGKYIRQPDWRLTRSVESKRFIQDLHRISGLLDDYPPLLGEAGQPGFWIAALGRQEIVAPILGGFGTSEREALARDWRDGRAVLTAHRRFLLEEMCTLRHTTWLGRLRRVIVFATDEHPMVWPLVLLAILVAAAYVVALILD